MDRSSRSIDPWSMWDALQNVGWRTWEGISVFKQLWLLPWNTYSVTCVWNQNWFEFETLKKKIVLFYRVISLNCALRLSFFFKNYELQNKIKRKMYELQNKMKRRLQKCMPSYVSWKISDSLQLYSLQPILITAILITAILITAILITAISGTHYSLIGDSLQLYHFRLTLYH